MKMKRVLAGAAALAMCAAVGLGDLPAAVFDYSGIVASAEVQILDLESTSAAIQESPDTRPSAQSPSDLPYNDEKSQYRDGTYTVPVYVYSALQNDDGTTMSMANGALKHEAVVNVADGSASITLGFNAITLDMGSQGEIVGHLLNLWYYDQSTHLQDTEKTFDYYYPNVNDFSNFEEVVETATFPLQPNDNGLFPSDVRCRVSVDAMGDSLQDCVLVIDWANLKCDFWNSTVSPLLAKCLDVSNDDGKYTNDSFLQFESYLEAVEGFSKRYHPAYCMTYYNMLRKAENCLASNVDVLQNGNYVVDIAFYNIERDNNTYLYSDGTHFASDYKVTEEKCDILTNYFGGKAEIVAENGVYTIKFTPSSAESEYYLQNMYGDNSGISVWGPSSLSKAYTTVDYFGTTRYFVADPENDYLSGTLSNKFESDSLMLYAQFYEKNSQSEENKVWVGLDIDWDNIQFVSNLVVDKTELNKTIASTNNLINKNMLTAYTDSSVQNLKTVLAEAEIVNNSDEATQTEVDNALDELKNATDSLVKRPVLKGYTATLSDSIGLNFYVNVEFSMISSNPYVEFTINGETTKAGLALDSLDFAAGAWVCKATAKLDAKQMTDVVSANIIVGDETVATFTGCVKDYADTIIANADNSYSNEAIAAAKALLNYGGYSQVLFNYNTDNLANASIDTDVSSVTADSLTEYLPTKTGSDDTAKFTGYNLYLDSLTRMRFYYIGDVEATSTAANYNTGKSGSKNYVEITDITPANLLNGYDLR